MTTTLHGRSAKTGPTRPRLTQVKLDLIDWPAEASVDDRRLPDIGVSEGHADIIMMLRPPVLMEVKADGQPVRYRAIGNVDALRWFLHANELGQHPTRQVRSLVLPAGSVKPENIEAIERDLIPLVFGEMSEGGARQARRKLKAAGIALSATDSSRCLRPLTRP